MREVTGIEIGGGACALVRMRTERAGSRRRISAAYTFETDDSLDRLALATTLRRIRRTHGFPGPARIVGWSLNHSSAAADLRSEPALSPILDAGFRIDEVLTAPEALAALARQRSSVAAGDCTAWVALNRTIAAIAVVGDGELLFSREFEWRPRPFAIARDGAVSDLHHELLRRYLVVAHLAEELRHAFEAVRETHGRRVDSIVTCGDLPDQPSLAMLLTEELDIEVETLHSLDDFAISATLADEIGDKAPAFRLACAAAAPALTRVAGAIPHLKVAVAAALVVGGVAWGILRSAPGSSPQPSQAPVRQGYGGQAPVREGNDGQARVHQGDGRQAGKPAAENVRRGDDSTRPTPTTGREETVPPSPDTSATPAPPRAARTAAERTAVPRAVDHERVPRPPVPIDAPLPYVNSIVVAPDRRLAVLDGAIVREGDAVGPRVLVRIEPDAVVLRERSGQEVRVPFRRRVGGG